MDSYSENQSEGEARPSKLKNMFLLLFSLVQIILCFILIRRIA